MKSRERYIELRHQARVLRDDGGYRLDLAQTNPVIFETFANLVHYDPEVPNVVWEPFAGHEGSSLAQDAAEGLGVDLISYDLSPSDDRVVKADSMQTGPGREVGGIILHPPYFGSHLMSSEKGELSGATTKKDYLSMLARVLDKGIAALCPYGDICAVCRRYRFSGKEVRMDEWMLDLISERDFGLICVWSSAPDIVLVFKR